MADFGLAEDMYGTNYYQRSENEGRERVPIRWMAPESIDMNIYNEATDVVSQKIAHKTRFSSEYHCLRGVVFVYGNFPCIYSGHLE